MSPYYEDDAVTLYLGDYRDGLDRITGADAVITDPPYGETSLDWDRWPNGWPTDAARIAPALWCFGSMRMFLENRDDFRAWKFSHEIVWKKHAGTGFTTDKFRRIHELAVLWYRDNWGDLRHEVPKIASTWPDRVRRIHKADHAPHMGSSKAGTWEDDGSRLQTTVIDVRNEHRRAIHPTQKPVGIVAPLIEYSVPRGGLVVDLFSGSGTVAIAARQAGRRCIAFEAREDYCEAAAQRLSRIGLDFGEWEA